MDLCNWFSSSSQLGIRSCIKTGYDRLVSFNRTRWRILWRKLKKQKKSLFEFSTTPPVHVPCYDPHTYSQNFDQGPMWDDPDNISRSFSARFAVPSRVFDSNVLVG